MWMSRAKNHRKNGLPQIKYTTTNRSIAGVLSRLRSRYSRKENEEKYNPSIPGGKSQYPWDFHRAYIWQDLALFRSVPYVFQEL